MHIFLKDAKVNLLQSIYLFIYLGWNSSMNLIVNTRFTG